MATCELPYCEKIVRTGNNVSHSKRRTKRTWKPNIRAATLLIGGQMRKIKACSRCIRTHYKLALKD
jgi:large subunit ribosomal protein L28